MRSKLFYLAILVMLILSSSSVLASPQSDMHTSSGGFTNASFQGNYAITATIGGNSSAALGACTMDGDGNFACSITINMPGEEGARTVIPVASEGTYQVNPDGSGTVQEIETLPDGSSLEVEHALQIVAADAVGPYLIATEVSGFSLAPGDPSGALLTQTLTRLPDLGPMASAGSAENAMLSEQLHQQFSDNDLEGALALADPEIEVVADAFGMNLHGTEQFMGFMQGFKTAFPDITIQPTNVVDSGDQVVVEFEATGTHTGPLATPGGEIPATGNPVTLKVVEVHTWQDGKLVKLVNYQDSASLLRQIGVIE